MIKSKECNNYDKNNFWREFSITNLAQIRENFFLRKFLPSRYNFRIAQRSGYRNFEKGGAVGRSSWLADKKNLVFRWSKKAKIALETIRFWRNIFISIFKFSPFLYTMKGSRWDLINFSKFSNALLRKEKNTHTALRKEKLIKTRICFITGYFIKPL